MPAKLPKRTLEVATPGQFGPPQHITFVLAHITNFWRADCGLEVGLTNGKTVTIDRACEPALRAALEKQR